jgi:hypothetical protein
VTEPKVSVNPEGKKEKGVWAFWAKGVWAKGVWAVWEKGVWD